MADWVSTKQATRLLGVGSTTIKRWANEGLLSCYRTAGGHRRYRLATIEALAQDAAVARPTSAEDTAKRWYEYLRDEDLKAVVGRIRRLPDSAGDWFAAAEALGAAMDQLARRWVEEDCSIAEANLASWKLLQAVSAVAAGLPAMAGAPRCLVATVPGDLHGVGAALAQLCLRGTGYEAALLGNGIPAQQLAHYLSGSGLKLLALSAASWHTDRVTLKQYLGDIDEACRRDGIELILGGRGALPAEPAYGYRCRSFTDLRTVLGEIDLR